VPTLIDPDRRDAHVAEIGEQVAEALATSDVLLFTSRTLLRGGDADDSLAISRTVSTAVVDVVQAALAARPAWVVAKGGITSHDVAVRGLGIRRAEVVGQLLPGMVSVFRPSKLPPKRSGRPTSSSPATWVTTTHWPMSSTSSPDADNRIPAQFTTTEGRQQI
jgi:putative nucleotide-binding sugar-metabolising enzyme